jgi:hypothetical protein
VRLTEPPVPDIAAPVPIANLPLDPRELYPVLRLSMPLKPLDFAAAVASSKSPLLEVVPSPLVIPIEPPDRTEEIPALMLIDPPTPLDPEPTIIRNGPPLPPIA